MIKEEKKNINKSSSKNNSEYEDNKMNSNYYNSDEEINSSKNDISNVRRNNFQVKMIVLIIIKQTKKED